MKKLIKRLFFYSSRQLYRRKRTYLSVFITSVVLLTLVTTFLEMIEANALKEIEQTKCGYYHASFLCQSMDLSEAMLEHSKVTDAFSIPYTSRMASSDDASLPAKLVVCNDEIEGRLEVSYLWGQPPEDGEIAVPADLYRTYGYLTAGEVNDLYFTAQRMTYYPLRISGIFETNDHSVAYAFVTEKTARAIDAETESHELYDTYITCRNMSDRYIAKIVEYMIREYRIPETEVQSVKGEVSGIIGREEVYEDYINTELLEVVLRKQATPSVLISMPLILVAALMMAIFMTGQAKLSSPEYGILGSLGADRRQLCTLVAGQILLISVLASVPVILLSAILSNIYISVYNLSITDVALRFRIPWGDLIAVSLWFDVFSCAFTYVGISRMTLQPPFTLIAESYRSSLPFVRRSSRGAEVGRHRVFYISLLQTLREIRGQIAPALTTSFVCIILGAFIVFEAVTQMSSANKLETFGSYVFDGSIEKTPLDTTLRAPMPVTSEVIDSVRELPEFESGGVYSRIGSTFAMTDTGYSEHGLFLFAEKGRTLPCSEKAYLNHKGYGDSYSAPAIVCDSVTLPLVCYDVLEGEPERILTEENALILIDGHRSGDYRVGDTLLLCGGYDLSYEPRSYELHGTPVEFTIVAIASEGSRYLDVAPVRNGDVIMSQDSAVALGLAEEGGYDSYLFRFKSDSELSRERLLSFYDEFRKSPQFIRYDCLLYSAEADSVRLVRIVNTIMFSLFFVMLFLTLCTMTFVESSLRINKKKNELAVLRQVGAKDGEIYRTTMVSALPGAVIAFLVTTVIYIVVLYVCVTRTNQNIAIQIDMYHPLEETIARWREELRVMKLIITCVWVAALPMHLLTYLFALLGIALPTRRALKETITDGLRKDTD